MIGLNRRTKVIVHDLLMVSLSWELAWLSRYNFSFPTEEGLLSLKILPFVLAAQGIILWRTGLYRGLWRFASIPDLWNIIRGAIMGTLVISVALFLVTRLEGIPRSVLVLYPLFLTFLLGGPRLTYRLWKDHSLSLRTVTNGQRVLILGAVYQDSPFIMRLIRVNVAS